MDEKKLEKVIETILIDNGLDQETYENRLKDILAEKFEIQERIKEAIEDINSPNYLQGYYIGLKSEPRIWEALEEIKEIQDKIDIIVEALKRTSKNKVI